MGLTQNDIEMLRAGVPEQFRADPSRTLNATFQGADITALDGAYSADLRSDQDNAADTVAQPNRDIVAERLETERQIQREIMNGDGSRTNLTVQDTAQWASLAQSAAQKEKDKKGGIDITTQIILLNQQIEALQRQIDFYEGENDRLQDEINEIDQLAADIRAGNVDPNDPRLAEYGITPEHLANGTALGKLDDARTDRQKQIADNKAKIDDAKADLADKKDDLDAALAENRANGGSVERNGSQTELDEKYIEMGEKVSHVAELEQRMLTLEDLQQYKSTDEYVSKIDEFIAGADVATLERLVDDPGTNPTVVERIGLHNFYDELSYLNDFKGTPDYQMYVQMAVDDAPESVRDALRKEPDLNEELATALYEPYSDEMDAEEQIETANVESETTKTPQTGSDEPTNHDLASKPPSMG